MGLAHVLLGALRDEVATCSIELQEDIFRLWGSAYQPIAPAVGETSSSCVQPFLCTRNMRFFVPNCGW